MAQSLVVSWHKMLSLFLWAQSSSREHYISSLQKDLILSSRILCCHAKDKLRSYLNLLFRWKVKEVKKWDI